MNQGSPPATPGAQEGLDPRSKRRRLSQVDEGNILVESTRKRKRGVPGDSAYVPEEGASASRRGTSPNPATVVARTPEEFEQVRQTSTILFDKLMQQRDPANYNRFLHEHFLELPDPVQIPEYYDKIKKPISLNQIKQKLDNLVYTSFLDAKTDMNQIFVNAKRFNAPGSPLFMDAKKLHKTMKAHYAFLTGEAPAPEEEEIGGKRGRRGSSSLPAGGTGADDGDYVDSGNVSGGGGGGYATGQKRGPTIKPWLLKKFDQLTKKTDQNGRAYSDVFKVLPDKRAWPEYYQYISQPISLDNILAKVNQRKYRSVDQFKTDVETSFNNAMFFNEEFSQIWNDAKTMLDHFAEIMKEVPPKFAPPRKYNTARRRAEAENAALENNTFSDADRAKSTQPNEDEQSQDESESGEESESGDYSGFPGGTGFEPTTTPVQINGFANPFAAATSIPVDAFGTAVPPNYAASPVAAFASPALASPQPPIDALTSLATLASSLSPQRPPLALPSNSVNASFLHPQAAQAPTPHSTAKLGSGAFSPKALAKIPSLGEVPLITAFTISTLPPTRRSVVLENLQARQHSLAVSPSTTRIEFEATYRRERPDGSIVTHSTNGGTNLEGQPAQADVQLSARKAEHFSVSDETVQRGGGTPSRFVFIPKKGLSVAEFRLVPKGQQDGTRDEVYRIFISK